MDEDSHQSEVTVIEGTPVDHTIPSSTPGSIASGSSAYQYQYLQQQQLAQQAFTRQLQTLQHAEPVGIPGSSSSESTPQQSVPTGDEQQIQGQAQAQVQVQAQNQAEAEANAQAQAHALAYAHAHAQAHIQAQVYAQSQAQAQSQTQQIQPQANHPRVFSYNQPNSLTDRERHLQQLQSIQQQQQLQQPSHSSSFIGGSFAPQQPINTDSRYGSSSNLVQSHALPGGHSLTGRDDPSVTSAAAGLVSGSIGTSPGTTTSAFFSPSSGSRFAPHTNLPSSVSSSYKSALPPGNSFSSYSSYPYNNTGVASVGTGGGPFNSNFTSFAANNSSLNDRTGIYTNNSIISRGFVAENSSSPTIEAADQNINNNPSTSSSFSGKSVQPGNVVRTSLLTSKLAASNNTSSSSTPTTNISSPSKMSTSRQSSFSNAGGQLASSNFPYPNPRASSRHNSLVGANFQQPYSSDPQNFSTSGPSASSSGLNRFSTTGTLGVANSTAIPGSIGIISTSSSLRQNFLPHPSSTTTNISMEQVSAASSADTSHNPSSSPMDTATDGYETPSNSFQASYQSPSHQVPAVLAAPGNATGDDFARRYSNQGPHLDIANHPVPDVLVMLTVLLQKIIDANDALHPHNYQASEIADTSDRFTANVLAFHGRNIPAISLHAYLSRILKYCPTTNEVFISLLVYFDRIAQRANSGELSPSGIMSGNTSGHPAGEGDNPDQPQLFVMDSYNIHRLIIAGVTVASKFFSDIFYKNSRYAKVGGLPVDELNHLELQFLLLTDFRLMITLEELQRYADLLLRFWQKEASQHSPHPMATGP